MPGAVVILVVLFVVGPFALFVGGAVWSALVGWMASDDADRRAGTAAGGDGASA
ncbi:MAG: hypothetical protein KatS3mg009_0699 [Acidimicrobiia bacterium]|nr:MAG: hypothetical protein KatS3mg009_0699 [Acidimicrobiia bacterium]